MSQLDDIKARREAISQGEWWKQPIDTKQLKDRPDYIVVCKDAVDPWHHHDHTLAAGTIEDAVFICNAALDIDFLFTELESWKFSLTTTIEILEGKLAEASIELLGKNKESVKGGEAGD